MSGRVEAIWLKRSHNGVMDPVGEANAITDMGLEGDAHFGRGRQVTVIAKETFDRIAETLPEARPVMRRANVMVSGISLENSRGKVLTLGGMQVRVRGETRPCNRMDEQCPGLTAALDGHWGGGVHGSVVGGGDVRVGDAASLNPKGAPDGGTGQPPTA